MSYPGIAGKSVIVTGASRGLGLAIATAFLGAGATVTLLAEDDAVEHAAHTLGAYALVADISNHAEIVAALREITRIDVLVNNAGLERLTPVEDVSADNEAIFRRILEVNVIGTFLMTRAALGRMQAGGRIINTASVWGRVAEPLFGAYVASKHAVIGLTKSWAKELGPRGITVNAVCPGWVETESSMRSLSRLAERADREETELLANIIAAQALPGFMQPADIVGPYLFLASDGAANITGQSIGIDRGEAPW
jgi:NAD(P)-dependent dehydrogenase (short-subunit alcohol dehydrogenase family)